MLLLHPFIQNLPHQPNFFPGDIESDSGQQLVTSDVFLAYISKRAKLHRGK